MLPNSPYSASKASSDLIARAYQQTYGVPVCVTRCSNNYGPYQFPEKLIPLFVTNLIDGANVPLYGEGATCATGCTSTTTAAASSWSLTAGRSRRDLQHRRRHRADQQAS